MCGICGFIEKNDCTGNRPPKEEILEQMMSALAHRGPDQGKSWLSDHAALGFRRLAIIDPGGSTQPMVNETKDKVLVFNGEIYNYQALRLELNPALKAEGKNPFTLDSKDTRNGASSCPSICGGCLLSLSGTKRPRPYSPPGILLGLSLSIIRWQAAASSSPRRSRESCPTLPMKSV